MIIAIGNDHHGFEQKRIIKEQLQLPHYTIEWLDAGSFSTERVDYPSYGIAVARALCKGQAQYGILLCGTGVGMAIVTNRFKGIYAALAWNEELAQKSKEDDNANILVIPSDYVTNEQVVSMITAWLSAPFKGGRYQDRITMIDKLGGAE
ncbi:RpiB/LacA/LacB family sugar-phosphate isomerase [Candidatus Dependentiae bacterium]|nr:MAG: RpiB/LacA/LacB family sugar-phosphate isomerase [Candidatus Dependentiae bacterium]